MSEDRLAPTITVPVLTPPARVPVLTPPVATPTVPAPPAPLAPFEPRSRYAPGSTLPPAAAAPPTGMPAPSRMTPTSSKQGPLPPSRFLVPAAATSADAPPPAAPAPVAPPSPPDSDARRARAPAAPARPGTGATTRPPMPPTATPPRAWETRKLFPPLPAPPSGAAIAVPYKSRSAEVAVGTLVLPRPAPITERARQSTRRLHWWMRAPLRMGRWAMLLCAGAICCLGWLVATYSAVVGDLPGTGGMFARVALIVLPPGLILLSGGILGRGSLPRLPLVLVALIAGLLPALLIQPPGALTPEWLARAPLLTPGFSAGAAIGFGWPPPISRSPRSTAWGAGLRAAGVAALGFSLPLLALIAFEAYVSVASVKVCSILTCYTQYLNVAYLVLAAVFAAIFGPLLALVGGAFGALLRGE